MKTFLALVLVLVCAAQAIASGYTLRSDGYYWKGDQAYTRTRVRTCYNGCYRYSWRYSPVSVKKYDELPTPGTENWRAKLLDWAQQRDRYNQIAKQSALEHNEFLEAVKVLGADTASAYNYDVRYASSPYNFGAFAYKPNAEQGSTVFGYGPQYSLKQNLELYGSTNIDAWVQQLGRGGIAAQETASRVSQGIQSAIEKESAAKERVAAYLAKAEILRAAEDNSVKVESNYTKYGSYASEIRGKVDSFSSGGLTSLIQSKCVGCHNTNNHPGKGLLENGTVLFPDGVNMLNYSQMSKPQKRHVVNTVLTGDMPKGGPALGVEETGLFFQDLLSTQ